MEELVDVPGFRLLEGQDALAAVRVALGRAHHPREEHEAVRIEAAGDAELPRIAHKYDLLHLPQRHLTLTLTLTLTRYDLVDLLQRHLTPGYTEDDLLLEVIVLIGELAGSELAAPSSH